MNYNFTICDSIKATTTLDVPKVVALGHKAFEGQLEMGLYQSVEDLPKRCWDKFVPSHHLFLRTSFLHCLETYPPRGMRFCYLLFHKNKQPVGVAICQILHFNAESSINEEEEANTGVLKSVGKMVKGFVARRVDFNTFIGGNLLLTGENGFYFDPQAFSQKTAMEIMTKGWEQAREMLQKEGIDLPITFLKDYFASSKQEIHEPLTQAGYHEFTIQPNMVFDLSNLWLEFDDYLAAMTSKYRVRAKRALKKAKVVERRVLNLEEIREKQGKIYELYMEVAAKSGFNTIILNPGYFTGLKEYLGDKFKLTGYFVEGELVSYFTTINCGKELEAHFLGYSMKQNRVYQLYHNMLFDIVRQGIELRIPRIIFARTALEIKSSVGAVAHEMHCYIKHRRSLSNKFVIKVFDYLNKAEEWTPRHPFR